MQVKSILNKTVSKRFRALEYAINFDLPIIDHCEDKSLAKDAVMHEGWVATRLGLRGALHRRRTVPVVAKKDDQASSARTENPTSASAEHYRTRLGRPSDR